MSGRPRRVLMTADTIGGVWTYALELTSALQRHHVAVDLATMGAPASPGQRAAADVFPNLTLHESTFRLEWMDAPWEDVRLAGEWLLDLERRLRPDIVHLNGFVHGSLPWRAPVLVVGHSCVYSWFDGARGETPPEEAWGRYRTEVIRGLQKADVVTAPSRTMLEALRKHYGAFRAAAPIYNGRRPDDFRPATKESFILTAGRVWDEAKNIAMLDAVAPRLPWPVRVAGEEQHPDVGGRANFDGIEPLGRLSQSELARQYARAAIFALPARYEPFGLCALEAALAGCALVLGDIPSLREVWADTALYVSPNRPDVLEATLRRLVGDEALRGEYAARARRRAQRYTSEAMADGYVRLYNSLASRPAARVHAVRGRISPINTTAP